VEAAMSTLADWPSSPPLEVLLVEDNLADVSLLREVLTAAPTPPINLTHVETMEDALAQLDRRTFNIALLDLTLPDCDGMETVQHIVSRAPALPVVVLTGVDNPDLGAHAVRSGAQDYLVKGQTDHFLLLRAIRYAIERKNAEEALRQANADLESRVAQRTAQLAAANTDLQIQIEAFRRLEAEIARLVETERLHLGMELHDNICQQLSAVAMRIASLVTKLRHEQSPAADTLAQLLASLRHAADDAHRLSRGLVPVEITADGLAFALEELAHHTQESRAVACQFHYPQPIAVKSNTVATHLFRIAQEAVQNAVKHARPTRIQISLLPADGITLKIEDDGRGIPPENLRTPGAGLRLMAYRARIIGAALSILANPAGGTLVLCTLPHPHHLTSPHIFKS
jgi:signal transduction histidine kinase